ncbi:MAG TPA: VOC family protein [Azospirillaceae bacterium]|nr:VOC family protein [Azospirillaceae bacterium]
MAASNDNRLDHVILGVSTLDQGITEFRTLTGVEPTRGGSHPQYGTVNALASMGDSYLEIFSHADGLMGGPRFGLIDFAMRAPRIEATAEAARQAGLEVLWVPGERRTPAGDVLRWRAFELLGHGFAGALPFFIDWQSTPNPARTAPGGLEEPSLRIGHPAADQLLELYRRLGIAIHLDHAPVPRLTLEVGAPTGRVSFQGEPIGWRGALATGVRQ